MGLKPFLAAVPALLVACAPTLEKPETTRPCPTIEAMSAGTNEEIGRIFHSLCGNKLYNISEIIEEHGKKIIVLSPQNNPEIRIIASTMPKTPSSTLRRNKGGMETSNISIQIKQGDKRIASASKFALSGLASMNESSYHPETPIAAKIFTELEKILNSLESDGTRNFSINNTRTVKYSQGTGFLDVFNGRIQITKISKETTPSSCTLEARGNIALALGYGAIDCKVEKGFFD